MNLDAVVNFGGGDPPKYWRSMPSGAVPGLLAVV